MSNLDAKFFNPLPYLPDSRGYILTLAAQSLTLALAPRGTNRSYGL